MSKPQDSLKPILSTIVKFRAFLVTLVILAVCGYTTYQISGVVAVSPDATSIESANKAVGATEVRFDMPTINTIVKQNPLQVSTDLNGIGTSNPFLGN